MLLRQPATANAAPASALPVDVRLMNAIAASCSRWRCVALAGRGRRVGRAPAAVPVRRRAARGRPAAQQRDHRARQRDAAPGGQLLHDGPRRSTRAAFEQVPWVRHAVVRRVWPNRLVVALEEHQPVALWEGDENSDKMVNSHGEVFEANVGDVEDDSLPQFAGPDGTSAAGAGRCTAACSRCSRGMDAEMTALRLSGRGSWKVELDDGAAIELGRGTQDEVVERTHALHPHAAAGAAQVQRAAGERGPAARGRLCSEVEGAVGRTLTRSSRNSPRASNRKRHSNGQGIQGSRRRPGHRHREGDGRRRRDTAGRRAAARRPGRRADAWPQARRRGQHRRHGAVHPAGLEGGRDDGRLQDLARLHGHHRQPHPRPELHGHGDRARQPRGHAHRHGARGGDRQGDQHPQRPARAAGRAAGVRDRRPRGARSRSA